MTQMVCVLTKILECGSADLDLLEDIEYDLDDIIEECLENGGINLHSIFVGVFRKGALELQEAYDERKEEIKNEIRKAIRHEYVDCVESGDMTEEELENCEEHIELLTALDLIENDELHPEEDVDYFLNFQDTHVSMKHLDFYKRWMENTVLSIEEKMGWEFECWGD